MIKGQGAQRNNRLYQYLIIYNISNKYIIINEVIELSVRFS